MTPSTMPLETSWVGLLWRTLPALQRSAFLGSGAAAAATGPQAASGRWRCQCPAQAPASCLAVTACCSSSPSPTNTCRPLGARQAAAEAKVHRPNGSLLRQVWRENGGAGALCAHRAHLCALCGRHWQHGVQQVQGAGSNCACSASAVEGVTGCWADGALLLHLMAAVDLAELTYGSA